MTPRGGPGANSPPQPQQTTQTTAQPQQPDLLLFQVAQQLGTLTGVVGQLNERVGEMAQGQQHTTAALERLGSDMNEQHAETAEKLGAVTGRLDGFDDRLGALERRFDQLQAQPPKPAAKSDSNAFRWWSETLTNIKTHAPWLIGVGLVLWGVVKGAIEWWHKGGTSQP